jgi:hypothetical protein
VTAGHTAANEGHEPEQHCVDASASGASRVQGCHEKKTTERNDGHPLQDAQRTRFKPESVLRIKCIGHQSGTG